MKKTIVLFLCVALLVLTACSKTPSTDENNPPANENNIPVGENNTQEIKVEEELLDVEITIPASFFEMLTAFNNSEITAQSVVDGEADSRLKDLKANEDGSLTFTMSKSDHAEFMEEMRQTIIDSSESLKDTFPCIQSIDVNVDCTKISLMVDRAEYESSFASMALQSLELPALMYQGFNGSSEAPVIVEAVDAETNEVIESINSGERQ